MNYLGSIGLEIHVQLRTRSKMFCGCSTQYGAAPNTQVCPVCLGYPGAMPVMNEQAVRLTVLTGLLIGSEIGGYSKFDRKSYFYPDMPKNYQITQYDKPLCLGGRVDFDVDGRGKSVRITRIHLEEDVGKSMHFRSSSGVDFNRAGVPLMEIVTEPDMETPEEAYAFLVALKEILEYGAVSDCNQEEGNIRCDVNCSLRPEGQVKLGTKAELKNLNSFKGVQAALRYELSRQEEVLSSGGRIVQETRRWDADAGVTYSMRSKEDAHDYRYFPEPDLMPIVLSQEQISEWRKGVPELPAQRRARFVSEYELPPYDAGVLVADRAVADYYEEAARISGNPKAISNWMMTEMLRLLSAGSVSIREVPVTPKALADLVGLVDRRTINMTTAKEIFEQLFRCGGDPGEIVARQGLAQVSDTEAVERMVDQAIAANAKSVEDYLRGKKAAGQYLVGQVMRFSKGKADPKLAAEILERKLQGLGRSSAG